MKFYFLCMPNVGTDSYGTTEVFDASYSTGNTIFAQACVINNPNATREYDLACAPKIGTIVNPMITC